MGSQRVKHSLAHMYTHSSGEAETTLIKHLLCGQIQAGHFSNLSTCLSQQLCRGPWGWEKWGDLPKVTLLESGRILPRTAGPQGAAPTTIPHCLHDAPFALAPNGQLGSSRHRRCRACWAIGQEAGSCLGPPCYSDLLQMSASPHGSQRETASCRAHHDVLGRDGPPNWVLHSYHGVLSLLLQGSPKQEKEGCREQRVWKQALVSLAAFALDLGKHWSLELPKDERDLLLSWWAFCHCSGCHTVRWDGSWISSPTQVSGGI